MSKVKSWLIATMVVMIAAIAAGGCRSTRPRQLPVRSIGQPVEPAAPLSHAEAVLAIETTEMAVEDQQRAEQAHEALPEKVIPYRDDPIQPVRRP